MKRRVGVYSGTFDPIHSGHVAFAQEAMRACKLDEVVFLPERQPRAKNNVTDIVHRHALIEYAMASTTNMRVINLESERFTINDTLPEIHRILGECDITFLMGSDVVRALYRWESLDILLRESSIAVGMRADDELREIATIMEQLARDHNIRSSYILISTQKANMTSSQIRDGTVNMLELYPNALKYMRKHHLYPWCAK